MKHLTLIRHAKSSWSDSSCPDFERPLNKRGQRDAPDMGTRLANSGTKFDMMVTSPARRALTTCEIIANQLDYRREDIVQNPEIYEASTTTLFRLITELDDRFDAVALTGHNPGMSMLSGYLCHEAAGDLPTCAIVQLEFDTSHWRDLDPESGKLLNFDYPKSLI